MVGSRTRCATTVLLLALIAAGCRAAPDIGGSDDTGEADGVNASPEGEASEEPPVTNASPPPAERPAPPPAAEPVALSDAEVYPNAKRLASEIAQKLTTYEAGDDLEEVVAVATNAEGAALETLLDAAGPLLHRGAWSRGEVVYPQLGGARPDRVSVMVLVQQTVGTATGTRIQHRTLDVRLRLAGDQWVFDALPSAGGDPPEDAAPLTAEAEAVLNDERIELPDSARWDILAGGTSPDLLRLMSRIAERTPYAVLTLSTGHPFEVFGTDRQSNHTKGRAVDIYRVGERDVIDDRSDSSTSRDLVEWLFDDEAVTELGSPWALDGFGGRSFTDVVHADHLHVGVGPGGTPEERASP